MFFTKRCAHRGLCVPLLPASVSVPCPVLWTSFLRATSGQHVVSVFYNLATSFVLFPIGCCSSLLPASSSVDATHNFVALLAGSNLNVVIGRYFFREPISTLWMWGKSLYEVTEESIIRRLQNTISWTCSEAECRDAVCLASSHRRLWGKSPCEVSESFLRRLQNTSSWTDSEAEYRDSVCVCVLRNSTQERNLPVADRARLTVVKLRLLALGPMLTVFGTENSSRIELECGMTPLVRGVSARSHLMGSQLG